MYKHKNKCFHQHSTSFIYEVGHYTIITPDENHLKNTSFL